MDKKTMLDHMKGPGDSRGPNFGVMQIAITGQCDNGTCSNCTQLMPYRHNKHMKVENAKAAIDSVADYPGTVGIFGGNPCLHPDFEEISRYLADVIPDRKRRGLWTNNLNGQGELVRELYGFYNFNVHGDHEAAEEMRQDVPEAKVWGEEKCHHGGVTVSHGDVGLSVEQSNELIAKCDINQYWSPCIVELGGRLKGFFCEVAAAFAAANGHRSGAVVKPGWWRKPMQDFQKQVDRYCYECGVPLRVVGCSDDVCTDIVSESYAGWCESQGRQYGVIGQADIGHVHEVTDYAGIRRHD